MKIVVIALALALSAFAQSPSLNLTVGPKGPTAIAYGGASFTYAAKSGPAVSQVSTLLSGVRSSASTKVLRTAINGSTLTSFYSWGNVATTYRATGNKLALSVMVTNSLPSETLDHLQIFPLGIQFPSAPKQKPGTNIAFNADAPSSIYFNFGSGAVDLVNDDVTRPLAMGFWAATSPASTKWQIILDVNSQKSMGNWLPAPRPIAPLTSDTYSVSLRFGPASATEQQLAGDVFAAYAAAFPLSVPAHVNRPIAKLILSSSALRTISKTNPRGWFNDPKVDVTTAAGVAAFQSRLLSYADTSIAEMQRVGAQGGILWDIEGQQTICSYVGDPSQAEALAPELVGVLDAFVGKFSAAGMRIGFTLRSQVFSSAGSCSQTDQPDPGAVLLAKMQYAVKRWGASLFYVDSDLYANGVVNPAVAFQSLVAAYPNALIFPEWKNPRHYAYTLPYTDPARGLILPSAQTLETYPGAAGLIAVSDPVAASSAAALTSAVHSGSMLLFDGWYRHPANDAIALIYKGLP